MPASLQAPPASAAAVSADSHPFASQETFQNDEKNSVFGSALAALGPGPADLEGRVGWFQ